MASGATDSQAQRRAPGRSLRSVSQASAIDRTMAMGTVSATRSTVLIRSSPTRGRKTRAETESQPVCTAIQMMKASGSSDSSETMMAARAIQDMGCRRDRPAAWPERARSTADCISSAAPLPPERGRRRRGRKRNVSSWTMPSRKQSAPAESLAGAQTLPF
jgi:hypothetical protein